MDLYELLDNYVNQVKRFHFLSSNQYIELLMKDITNDKKILLEFLHNFNIHLHSALFQIDDLQSNELIVWKREFLPKNLIPNDLLNMFKDENKRLRELYQKFSLDIHEQLKLYVVFAYYGMINLDGFRTSLWLARSLEKAMILDFLPAELVGIRKDLLESLIVSLKLENISSEKRTKYATYSLYESFNTINIYLNKLLSCDLLKEIELYSPSLDLSRLLQYFI